MNFSLVFGFSLALLFSAVVSWELPEQKKGGGNSDCIKPNSLPANCSNCLENAQCEEGSFCCPYMKKCVWCSRQKCHQPIANCRPPCDDALNCPSCKPTNGATYPEGWQKPTCGLTPSTSPTPTPSTPTTPTPSTPPTTPSTPTHSTPTTPDGGGNSDCIKPNSLPANCTNCLETAQCEEGFCCPFLKKCVKTSHQKCRYPLANCRPPCDDALNCPSCKPTNGATYPDGWQKPTCGLTPSTPPTPTPSTPPTTTHSTPPTPDGGGNSDCIKPNSLPANCTNCLENAQCKEGSFCCPYMKKCMKHGQKCRSPHANCNPRCHDALNCPGCKPTDGSKYPEGWQKPTCGLTPSTPPTLTPSTPQNPTYEPIIYGRDSGEPESF